MPEVHQDPGEGIPRPPKGTPHLNKLPPFFTIGTQEYFAVAKSLRKPLSGYLGGRRSPGYWITALSTAWCEAFDCKYAIPCNSATSGLLAACLAIGIKPGDEVWVSGYTMSASAACAKVLGASLVFIDIETLRLSMSTLLMSSSRSRGRTPKCIIVTNLFGHPAYLATMRSWCDSNKIWMIEDNAQAPFAKENGHYAGTIGHIGVFSLNVHKHIQCGEGGVVVTDDADLAALIEGGINHGELALDGFVGLNLRMTEPIAAIACTQLKRATAIIQSRINLALELTDMFSNAPLWLRPPIQDIDCIHVYYMWAAIVSPKKRWVLWNYLFSHGFPVRMGYSTPLPSILDPTQFCFVCNRMEEELITFEVCAYDPTTKQRKIMREIAQRALDHVDENCRT